MRAKS